MMEKEELYARIEELERELAEERIRRKITEDNSDCALWEYEIASKKYVLSRKLGGKWNTTNMVIENYQEQMHAPQWTGATSISAMRYVRSVMSLPLSGSVM